MVKCSQMFAAAKADATCRPKLQHSLTCKNSAIVNGVILYQVRLNGNYIKHDQDKKKGLAGLKISIVGM